MTEDDTFLALKRTPFRQLFIMCADRTILGQSIGGIHNLDLIQANGWDYVDFVFEMDKHPVSFSWNDINRKEWRDNFLSGCEGR